MSNEVFLSVCLSLFIACYEKDWSRIEQHELKLAMGFAEFGQLHESKL